MPLLKHDCRWRERMKLNQIRKLKKGVWCPVHILTMETSHKKFSSFTKVFKSAPLFSKQENCKCASSTASISRLYPCLWVFPNNHMVSKYCQLVISSSAHVIFVFEQCPKLWMKPMGDGHFYTIPSRFECSKPVDESEWKWMKMDESRWKYPLCYMHLWCSLPHPTRWYIPLKLEAVLHPSKNCLNHHFRYL